MLFWIQENNFAATFLLTLNANGLMTNKHSVFESSVTIRPSDIDMNNHVHNSKYLDYLLYARFDQMQKDYKMSMEEFIKMGYSWVTSSVQIDYKRALKLGDNVIVKTQVDSYQGAQVKVNYWIVNKDSNKIAAEGTAIYTMVSIASGRPVRISEEIIERYSV